jgi:hypothetical protein
MTPLIPSSTQLKTLTRATALRDYGPELERICRGLAIAIAFAYAAGYVLGHWLHQINDKLAGRPAPVGSAPVGLVVHQASTGDPQPPLLITCDPQPVQRTAVSKLPIPSPKPSRKRSAKAAATTGFKPATA